MKENLSNLPIEEISDKQIEFYLDWTSKHNEQGLAEKAHNTFFDEIFGKNGVVAISGLRMPPAIGFEGYQSLEQTKEDLIKNLSKLRNTGIDGVVLESYMDRPHKIFYDNSKLLNYYLSLAQVAKEESGDKFKVGINLILFDIYGSLAIAKSAGLDFVAVDEYVNPVECSREEANFDHSFVFDPKPSGVATFQKEINGENILILGGTHSNYYPLVEPVTFESSVKKADKNSASAIILGKNNKHLFQPDSLLSLPVLISGGIRYEDLDWIKTNKFRGFLAGSLFEEGFGIIDSKRVETVLKVLK